MYKLTTEKSYEFTIKAPKLENFDVEFSIMTESINYNIKLTKKSDNIYELIIPKELDKIHEEVNYNIFLYSQNNRFSIDSGELQLTKTHELAENNLTEIDIKLISEDVVEEIQLTSHTPKIELKDMIRKDYVNKKIKDILKDIKK